MALVGLVSVRREVRGLVRRPSAVVGPDHGARVMDLALQLGGSELRRVRLVVLHDRSTQCGHHRGLDFEIRSADAIEHAYRAARKATTNPTI